MGKLEVHFEMGGIRNETYHPTRRGGLADGGEEKKTVGKATLLDKTLKILIDMPLLRENGTLTEESGKAIIKIEGNHALFLQ